MTPTTGLSLNLKKCELVLSSQVGIGEATSFSLLSQVRVVRPHQTVGEYRKLQATQSTERASLRCLGVPEYQFPGVDQRSA